MEIASMFPTLNPNGWQQPRQLANRRPIVGNLNSHSSSSAATSLSRSQKSLLNTNRQTLTTPTSANNNRNLQNQMTAKNPLATNSSDDTPSSLLLSSSSSLSSANLNYQLTSHKFHRAAIDGYIDILCAASKRETNSVVGQDQLGSLTPTLLAASSGQLDALRILVGRGGDPEKTSSQGSSALHLAAAKNHLNCVSFLVNFGVNMWSLDNELHTAKDVAAIGQQKEVLDYLDQMMAKRSAISTKQVQKLKEKAKLAAEKRIKLMRKEQMRAIKQVEKDERLLAKLSNNRQLLKAAHSISDIKLVGRPQLEKIDMKPTTATTTSSAHGSRFFEQAATDLRNKFISQRCNSSLNLTTTLSSLSSCSSAPTSTTKSFNYQCGPSAASTTAFNHSSDLESAYSSSVSSNSGYLSSSSARSFLRAMIGSSKVPPSLSNHDFLGAAKRAPFLSSSPMSRAQAHETNIRPKYSDLVAISQSAAEQSPLLSLKSAPNTSSAIGSSKLPNATPSAYLGGSNSAFVSNNSTTTGSQIKSSKLRAKSSGVTRKVQLKRLLFLQKKHHQLDDGQKSIDNSQQQQAAVKSNNNSINSQPNNGSGANHSGAMRRAKSEPDFMSFGSNNEKQMPTNYDHSTSELSLINADENNNQHTESPPAPPPPPPLPPSPPPPQALSKHLVVAPGCKTRGNNLEPNGDHDNNTRLLDQHHHQRRQQLLTRCLSQLKLQHETINRPTSELNEKDTTREQQQPRNNLIRPSQLAALSKQVKFEKSDELIKHQLNANEFPLRPSIIKQNKQQQHSHTNRQNKSTTITSIDSIGSAGSLIERNSSSASSSTSKCVRSSGSPRNAKQVCRDKTPGQSDCQPNLIETMDGHGGRRILEKAGEQNIQDSNEPLVEFLTRYGLIDLMPIMVGERIDLEALLLLTDLDLKSINILLGPRRKLLNAINQHKSLQSQQQKQQMNSREQRQQQTKSQTSARDSMNLLVIDTKF